MHQFTSASLFQTFTSLMEAAHQLSTRLAQAAESLKERGEIPSEHLLEDIVSVRSQFLDLRAQGIAAAEALSLPSQLAAEPPISLSGLKIFLEEVNKTEEQRTRYQDTFREASAMLDRVLMIQHQDQESFPPLLECHERAREMYKALEATTWSTMHPAIEALAKGEDPFSDLLTWIEQQHALDDDHWALLQDTVEQFFGKQLAIAVSRGKLFLAEPRTKETKPPHSLPMATSEEVHATPYNDSEVGITTTEQESPREETSVSIELPQILVERSNEHKADETFSVSELTEETPTPVIAKEDGDFASEAADTPRLSEAESLAAVYSFGPDDPAQHIAATMIQGQRGSHYPKTLRDLTWRLIFEDKLTLAFHLVSYLDAKHPQLQLRPPGWLLRSIILGRHIRHAKGETARFLEGDFRHFSPSLFVSNQNEWNQAVTFLLAAATFQPALLAPHTQAPAVLQSLRWEASLPQLSSYSKSIADYGASQSPLNPNHLKKGKEQASWQSEIDTLKQAVELWWTRAPRIAFTYAPAAKVWQKWLEQKGVIATLLSPIRQNETSKATIVKQTIDTFSDDAHLIREVHHTDHEILGRHLGGDISGRSLEQLRFHIREALGFARRWVELQEIYSGQRPDVTFEKMEQLRQTIWTLQGAVQEELSLFKRRHPSPLLMSGVVCCRRAIDHLQILFDPEATFPTEEPLPRPLLYADLLRIPTVSLNDQWEVEGSDWEALVDGVLELLANSSARKAAA